MASLFAEMAKYRPVRACYTRGELIIRRLEQLLAPQAHWAQACAGLLCLQVILIFTHTPWLDEWQALLIALQTPTLSDLMANLRYEGHPPLWYLLLRGLGLVLPPASVLPVAALVTALIGQACVLRAAPFSRVERLLLAGGCFVLFEFFTISRSASLGVAMLLLAVSLWHSRWCWIAIAMLPMCDFLFGVLSGILVLLKLRDRHMWWPGAALWLAVGLAAAWSVRPALDIVPALEPRNAALEAVNFFVRLGSLLVPLQTHGIIPRWDGVAPFGLGIFLAVGFLLLCWRETAHDRLHRWLLLGFIAFSFAFNLAVYVLPVRHLMLIAILLILLGWIKAAGGQKLSRLMRLWLLAGGACGLLVAAINLAVPFDRSAAVAAIIRQRGLEHRLWMAFPDSQGLGVGIHALTGMQFMRPEQRCMQGFIHWNYRGNLRKPRQFAAYLREETQRIGRFYLLTAGPLKGFPKDLVQPLDHVAGTYGPQRYHLFVVGPNLPDAAIHLPPCVPGLRPLSAARIWHP